MSDPDDDALTWSGDDLPPVAQAGATGVVRHRPVRRASSSGGGIPLIVLGCIAVLETLLWIRSVLDPSIASSVTPGSGSAAASAAYVANLIGRGLAAAAPLVWFGLVAWRVRPSSTRLAWLLLGATLLVPWPFVLRAT